MALPQPFVALAAVPPAAPEALSAAVLGGRDAPMTAKAAKPQGAKGDPLVARMDALAGNLLDKAQTEGVELRDSLDVFKELARWVAIKKGVNDGSGGGQSIEDFKRRLHETNGPPHRGKIDPGLYPRVIGRHAPKRPAVPSALDAIKKRLPGADPGDDAGGGNGAVRTGIGAAGGFGSLHSGGDGDD